MSQAELICRVRRAWVGLAGVPVEFPSDGVEVVVSPESGLCPSGWVGVVVIGGAGIATVPLGTMVRPVSEALAGLSAEAVTDPDRLRVALPVEDVLGPATLAYLDEDDFCPAKRAAAAESLSPQHADLAGLLASVDAEEAGESGLGEITSAAFAVRDGTRIVAAAGYRHWPGSVAHVSVLTAPEYRGQGLAKVAASAAAGDALQNGLLPQWRARPEPSRRVARALGFRQLGSQLSIRLDY